jgi:voltage-gated potassium channel
MGLLVGVREGWSRFDSVYWAFITATTVGYGDIRPLKNLSKMMSILIAITGMIFTGIIVALALNAATMAFKHQSNFDEIKQDFNALQSQQPGESGRLDGLLSLSGTCPGFPRGSLSEASTKRWNCSLKLA